MKRGIERLLGCLWLAACGSVATPVLAGQTVYFQHRDAQYLYRGQHEGGAALIPDGADAETALPLVVFLHGTNSAGELHLWFGGGGRDLRPLVEHLMHEQAVRPLVFAGPSQTRGATLARTAWEDFDLHAFVDDVVTATAGSVKVDREQVLLAGHSGAGCNPDGGLASDFWSAQRELPLALVSIDPCLDRELGRAFARRPSTVPLWLSWQSAIWTRSPEQFAAGLSEHKPPGRVDRLLELPARGVNPHEAIVPVALERALREAFPAGGPG